MSGVTQAVREKGVELLMQLPTIQTALQRDDVKDADMIAGNVVANEQRKVAFNVYLEAQAGLERSSQVAFIKGLIPDCYALQAKLLKEQRVEEARRQHAAAKRSASSLVAQS